MPQSLIEFVSVFQELHRENNVNHRGRVLKELCEIVASRKLEEVSASFKLCSISHHPNRCLQGPVC